LPPDETVPLGRHAVKDLAEPQAVFGIKGPS
jgi:hypothetical protein